MELKITVSLIQYLAGTFFFNKSSVVISVPIPGTGIYAFLLILFITMFFR